MEEKGRLIKTMLQSLMKKYDFIKEIKGMGLLVGISIGLDTKKVIEECFNNGLLLVGAGTDVIRLLPPLNVSFDEIDKAISIIDKVLYKFKNK